MQSERLKVMGVRAQTGEGDAVVNIRCVCVCVCVCACVGKPPDVSVCGRAIHGCGKCTSGTVCDVVTGGVGDN